MPVTTELLSQPVFDYEQVLVAGDDHVLAPETYVTPEQFNGTEITIGFADAFSGKKAERGDR